MVGLHAYAEFQASGRSEYTGAPNVHDCPEHAECKERISALEAKVKSQEV